jgi:hypothetical protein
MKDKKEVKHYWKEAGLVFLGAVLASIPILIASYIQTKAQQHQLILDRRISALKDYSIAYNKLATDFLPAIEKLDSMVAESERQFSEKQLTSDEINKNLNEPTEILLIKGRTWIAEVNAQTAIVNALFKTNLPQRTFSLDKPDTSNNSGESFEQYLKNSRDALNKLKTHTIENFNEQQKVINELSSIMLED